MRTLKKIFLVALMVANVSALLAQTTCNLQVKTYPASCKGAADGKAEIWKDGQLVVINPTGNPNCTPPETPTQICSSIPSSAKEIKQTSGVITLDGNQTYYLSATTFSGGFMFNGPATLIICNNATISQLNINETQQPVKINVNGTATITVPNFNFNPNVTITNYGTINVQGVGFNGNFYNHGTLNSNGDFSINSISGYVYNTGKITTTQSFNLDKSSVFTNNGTVNVTNQIHNNGSGSIVNNCTITAKDFLMEAPTENSGNITISNATTFNSGALYKGNSGSLLSTLDLMVNDGSSAQGIGTSCASIKVNRSTTLNKGALFTGKIDLCRGTGAFNNGGAIFSNGATANCSCTPTVGGGTTSGTTGTITWSIGTSTLNGSTAINLPAGGPYKVSISINGCTPVDLTFSITDPPAVTASATLTNKLATVTASGGNDQNYTYYWSDGFTSTVNTRDFTSNAPGTYCVTVKDSKGCPSNSSCVVIQPVTQPTTCTLKVDYQANNIVVVDGTCSTSTGCPWKIVTSSNANGVASVTFSRPCRDSIINLIDCNGNKSTTTISGKNTGCNPGTCPDPLNASCPTCPDPGNPACCPNPPCCNKELNPSCNPGNGDLTITATVTPPSCKQGGRAVLTVTGGSGNYLTSNPVNSDQDLDISGLPAGQTVVTVRDPGTNKIGYATVTIPPAPTSAVTINNSASPVQVVNNSFTIQISNAISGPYDVSLGSVAPYNLNGLQASNGSLSIGPINVTAAPGNGPFPVKITDSYCTEYNYTVYKSICYDPALSGFTPSYAADVLPSYKGKQDGSITLTNLPAGFTAVWSGTGIAGSVTGTTLSAISAGTYKLTVKNNNSGCVSQEFQKVLKDGNTLTSTATITAGANCSYTITAQYKDADGNLLVTPLASPVKYAWINPVNNEILSAVKDYKVNSKPLYGKPSYLKIEVTDGNGNSGIGTFDIPSNCYPTGCHPSDVACLCPDPNVPCGPLTVKYTATPSGCGQASIVQLTVTGGVDGNYRTSNPDNDQTGLSITGLAPGLHEITVYDVTSQKQTPVTVNVPGIPVGMISVINNQNPSLANNSSFTIAVSGAATGPYSITFEGFSPYYLPSVTASGGSLGTYALPTDKGNGPFIVTVTDSYCNKYPLVVFRNIIYCTPVITNLNYVPVVASTIPAAQGQFNGSLSISNQPLPSGATAIWTGTGFAGSREGTSITGLPAGTYQVVIKKKAEDCIVYLDSKSPIVLNDGPSVSASYSLAATGTGCTYSIDVVKRDVKGNLLPLPGGLTYKWINPYTGLAVATTQTFDVSSVTLAGNPSYLKIQVIDGNGISGAGEFVIPVTCKTVISCVAKLEYSVKDPVCAGGSTGEIHIVSADGGYIDWITPSIIQGNPSGWDKTGLTQGNYEVQLIKSGCRATYIIGLSDPAPMVISRTDFSPAGTTIQVQNGTAPFSYKWKDQTAATSDNSRTGLTPGGTYEVEVTDVKGCKGTLKFIYDPCALNKPQPYAVYTETEKRVTIIPNGGISDFQYYWDKQDDPELDNQYGQTKFNLPAGTYSITVTDGNGCTGATTYTNPDCGTFGASVTVTTQNATASSICDGIAYITISGVSNYQDYVILWDKENILDLLQKTNGLRAVQDQSAIRIYNICSGDHEVFVKSGGNQACAIRKEFTLKANTVDPPTCNLSTLTITPIGGTSFTKICSNKPVDLGFNVSGGKMPYSYSWEFTPQDNSAVQTIISDKPGFSDAQAGSYKVTVTDALGCTKTQNYSVIASATSLSNSNEVIQPTCPKGFGSATVTVNGASGTPTISWSDNSQVSSFKREDLTGPKTYTYVVTSGTCTTAGSVTIRDVAFISSFDTDTMRLCSGKQITLAAHYMPEYNITWSTPTAGVSIANPQSDLITVTQPGTYVLTRTHKTNAAHCPALTETMVVAPATTCTPVSQPCQVYEYDLPNAVPGDGCSTSIKFAADAAALQHYSDYLEALKHDFSNQYVGSVMNSLRETFKITFSDNEQQYTLYYYDQAGNLVRTVPPAGVVPLNPTQTTAAENYWLTANDDNPSNDPTGPPSIVTQHTLATTYKYNSLNQLIAQDMPDHAQQDLWEGQNTLTLAGGETIASLEANGSKVWAFANTTDEAHLYTSVNGGKDFVPGLNLNLGNILDIQKAGATGEMYFAVGTGGLILKALNGASTWSLMQGPTTNDLVKVFFNDQNNGYILDKSGNIWKTSGSGSAWSTVTTSATYLTTALGSLAADLAGKTISDVKVVNAKLYITANDNSRGYVYISADLTNNPASVAFIRTDFKITNPGAVVNDGTNIDVINGQYVFRKTGTAAFTYLRKNNLTGTINQYISNGSLHVVKTSADIYKSTDGINFTSLGGGFTTTSATVINSNGRIAVYQGTNISVLSNTGTLTSLATGTSGGTVSGYFYDGTNDFVAVNNNTVYNATAAKNYPLSANNIGYFSSFVVSGNVLLVCGNNIVYSLKFSTTGANNTPTTVAGNNVNNNYKEVKRIGNGIYAINISNQIFAVTITNATTPAISIATTATTTLAGDYNTGFKSFAFGAAPTSYTYLDYNNKVWNVVSGGAAVELKLTPGMITSTALGNNNIVYAPAQAGVVYRDTDFDNVMEFDAGNVTSDFTVSTTTSDAKLRVAASDNKIYHLDLQTNNAYTFTEETVSPVLTAPVKSISKDYLLTADGKVYMATNNAWTQQVGVNLVNYNVINGANATILAGGNNAAISYKSGASWAAAAPFKVSPILDVAVSSNGSKLVAVGKNGTILSSNDGGASFSPVFAPGTTDLNSVALFGGGFVTASVTGNLYYYANGSTFAPGSVTGTTISTGLPVRKMFVSPTGMLWVLRGRELLFSQNATSYAVKLTAAQDLYDITLNADGYGYIVGNLGVAYRVVPTGVVEEPESTTLTPVAIGDGKDAKLIATDNIITDDKGTGIPPSNLRTVQFKDRTTGYITGTGGIVLKTTDGGYHWHPEGQYSNSSSGNPMLAFTSGENGVYADINSVGTLRDRAMTIGSRFWYDEIGRLTLSQNAKQYNIESYLGELQYDGITVPGTGTIRAYSYTMYDDIGRITEVGELLTRRAVDTAKFATQVAYKTMKNVFIPSGVRNQITRTYYDRVAFANIDPDFVQENLRPRVASVTYQDREGTAYDRATHYSYDIHGNVSTLIQEIKNIPATVTGGVPEAVNMVKRLDYDYDLLSGKVNYVYFQKGKSDGFIHRYSYDGDNRLTEVYTSTDGVVWNKEANYDYYAHGPLARVVTGRDAIDQCDYAYTMHGWIKGVNSQNFAYALGYYNTIGTNAVTDYTPIGGATLQATPMAKSLFNGNISTMTTNTPAFATQQLQSTFTQQFTYDQLNRITSSKLTGGTNNHKTYYSYDGSGNLIGLSRYNSSGAQFDTLAYKYHQVDQGYLKNTNRLRWVDDGVTDPNKHSSDIEDQARDNYGYDDIGNLMSDASEEIDHIEWTTYGKVKAVIRKTGSSSKLNLYFSYDASGNRVVKKTIDNAGNVTTSYYLRDASGNTMAVFQKIATNALALSEQDIYGSSRLGMFKPSSSGATQLADGIVQNLHEVSLRNYEKTDNLGNVHLVLSDRISTAGVSNVIAAYEYYAFGMMLQNYENPSYRYGFNGKEKDEEFHNSYNYGLRIYDPRLAKFLTIDPLTSHYPWYTPYQYAGNQPILCIDLDGLEPVRRNNDRMFGKDPVLTKPSEWYVIDGTVSWNSFDRAARYNIQNNNPGAYQSIEDRHNFYMWANSIAKKRDNNWFQAAADVTSWRAVGGADIPNLGFITDEEEFIMRSVNEHLLGKNIKNFGPYLVDEKNPITYNGQSFGHLSGSALENKMVEIEQTEVEDILKNTVKPAFIEKYGEDKWEKAVKGINELTTEDNSGALLINVFTFGGSPASIDYAVKKFKEQYKDVSYNFSNKEHRIFIGQKMAEYIRNEKKEKK